MQRGVSSSRALAQPAVHGLPNAGLCFGEKACWILTFRGSLYPSLLGIWRPLWVGQLRCTRRMERWADSFGTGTESLLNSNY